MINVYSSKSESKYLFVDIPKASNKNMTFFSHYFFHNYHYPALNLGSCNSSRDSIVKKDDI